MTTADAIPVVTGACLGIGFLAKQWEVFPDRFIPTLVAIAGAALTGWLTDWSGMNVLAGFSAGLGATGVNQLYRQSRPEAKDQPPTQ